MKTNQIISSFFASALLFSSCDNSSNPAPDNTYDYTEVLSGFVDNTIIATYADMKDNAKLLFETVSDFNTSGNQDDLNKACGYWAATRAPWESGEAFLFGPAAFNNLDPLLDSWPLDQNQLDQVLSGTQDLTAEYVRDGLGAVLRGFHTVEYLLFRNGKPRDASAVTQREKEYLLAVTQVLRDDCITLWALWEGGATEQAILNELEIEIGTPYGDEFKNAGNAGSRYVSQTDAMDEMLQGMIGIADEVANGKIADPHTSGDVLDVESWFSWNSLTDFTNNIRSIENTYLGGYNQNSRGASISNIIAEKNTELNVKVITLITESISAINAIPEPYRNNLNNEAIQPAMDKINELMTVLQEEVRPLIIQN